MAPRLAPCWRRLTICRNGRAFAAYLGLVPRQHASGEKSAMRGITKHGQSQARAVLWFSLAQTLLIRAAKDAKAGQPLDRLRAARRSIWPARKHRNVAVTAIAARLARIAWAVIARNTPYRSQPTA